MMLNDDSFGRAWAALVAVGWAACAAAGPPALAIGESQVLADGQAQAEWAQESSEVPGIAPAVLSFYFENDGTFARPNDNTDRHYTSGQGASVAWRGGGRGIADALGLSTQNRTATGLVLAQQIFTPDNISLPREDDDRPYAGYLFLGGFWQRQDNNLLDHVQIDVGVVGPSSLAEQTQEVVHDVFGAEDPDWSGQLGDELQVNLTLRRKWRVDLGESTAGGFPVKWQLIPRLETDLGTTYRRAAAGGVLRVGYQLVDDFGPGGLTDLASETSDDFANIQSGVSVFVFGEAVVRYVEWNTFLDGSNSRDPSLSVSSQPWVGEFGGGFGVEWKRGRVHSRLGYTQTYSTREFETQNGGNTVGSIALRIAVEF